MLGLYVKIWNMSLSAAGRASRSVPGSGVGVLDRSVAILAAVGSGARTFTGLVEATGYARSTTHRLVKALEAHGLIELDGAGGYRPGLGLLRLAGAAVRELPLRDVARPFLERLAAAHGESAQLFVRSGAIRLCADVVESTNELRTIVAVGASLPLTAGSAGKVFLAWMSDPDRDRLLEGYRPMTSAGPDKEQLMKELETIHRRGWASSSGEREEGVASVSAPLFGPDGRIAAAVSLSGPVSRLGRARARLLAPVIVSTARAIEQALEVS
jgi:DNA-binding IclR family transcriptional regulator